MSNDPLDPLNVAADYVVSALGKEDATLARAALQADWMTAEERERLAPFSDAISRMAGIPSFRPKRELALALVNATDEESMYEAEAGIWDRLKISLDETELGPTQAAVDAVEKFVSETIGRDWTYAQLAFSQGAPRKEERPRFPHNDPDYDRALSDVSKVEQAHPCTCQIKAKKRTSSALVPSLIDFTQDLDPDCELHNPWVIEDEAARIQALRWWFAGRQVGFAVGAAGAADAALEYAASK